MKGQRQDISAIWDAALKLRGRMSGSELEGLLGFMPGLQVGVLPGRVERDKRFNLIEGAARRVVVPLTDDDGDLVDLLCIGATRLTTGCMMEAPSAIGRWPLEVYVTGTPRHKQFDIYTRADKWLAAWGDFLSRAWRDEKASRATLGCKLHTRHMPRLGDHGLLLLAPEAINWNVWTGPIAPHVEALRFPDSPELARWIRGEMRRASAPRYPKVLAPREAERTER